MISSWTDQEHVHEHAGPNISKKLHVHRFFVFILFVLLSASHSYAQDMIGVVSALSGNASIIRNSEEIPAESGTPIFQDDVINSADNSRVQILLKDQTAINLGANAIELGQPNVGTSVVNP